MPPSEQEQHLPKVLAVLDLLTEEELGQLNRLIVARIRLMQQIKAHGQMMNLRVGQRVRFRASTGQLVRGVLSRLNRKTVTIVTDAGHEWLVSPSLLEKE